MTLTELKNEVAALGFERDINIDTSFITAANRALLTIFSERPVAKTVRIPAAQPKTLLHIPTLRHEGGKDITLSLVGKAYAFRVSGVGSFTPPGSKIATKFTASDGLYRGFIKDGEGVIKFSGEHFFTVYNLVTYADTKSSNINDIPEYRARSEYDINFLGDFLFLLEPPESNGEPITDATLENGCIKLSSDGYDEIYLTYARAPRRIYPDIPNAVIDIPYECAHLLPLLTASYLWLDDDAERAQYYMSLYQNGMGFIRRYHTGISRTEYGDVTGWA